MALLEVFFYFERCNERDCEVTFGTMSMTKYVVEVSWKAVGFYKQPFMVESLKESDAKFLQQERNFLAVEKLFLVLKMLQYNTYRYTFSIRLFYIWHMKQI